MTQDVARAFVAASLAGHEGASVHNLRGHKASVEEIVAAIGSDAIAYDDVRLPFPEEVDSASLAELLPGLTETPLDEGVRATVEQFRALLAAGKIAA